MPEHLGSWDKAERRYRHLVQHWHPDRHDAGARESAQVQFIEIADAFKQLRAHFRRHGRMPALVVGRSPANDAAHRPPEHPDNRLSTARGSAEHPAFDEFAFAGFGPRAQVSSGTLRNSRWLRNWRRTALGLSALALAVSLIVLAVVLDQRLATGARSRAEQMLGSR